MTAPQVIADLCRRYAPQLHAPAGVDPARLLWAISGCESDFGVNCQAAHELAYCHGGRYEIKALTLKWGCVAHCSLGPWQMMFGQLVTYHPLHSDFDPAALLVSSPADGGQVYQISAENAIRAVVPMLNEEIFGRQQAPSLVAAAKAWNHGNWRDQFDDSAYTDRAAKFYATPMPESSTPEVTHVSSAT